LLPLARLLVSCLCALIVTQACLADSSHLKKARALLNQAPLIDGHNDTPWQFRKRVHSDLNRINLNGDTSRLWPPMHTDMRRLRLGGLGAQFWSVYLPTDQPNAVAAFHNQVRLVHKMIERYAELELALTADQIVEHHSNGKIASMLGVEGGHALGNGSLAELRWLYDNGVRYMTLTHTQSNAMADSSGGPALHGGLSKAGRKVVAEMNRLGMMIDISHTSDDTASQVLDLSTKPVLFTHSNARGLTQHERNVPDKLLQKLQKNDGVIMLSFVPDFVHTGAGEAQMSEVADHFDYVKRLIGVNHIGVGGDFDGISRGPVGLEDVSKYPDLFAELLRRGWTEEELKKVAGGNLLRVMRANEASL
jgi:membrane dipeptidase